MGLPDALGEGPWREGDSLTLSTVAVLTRGGTAGWWIRWTPAQEQIDAAHEERGDSDRWPRIMAVTVSFLAASLALAELGAKSSQTEYITHNISASDTWNQYQAKSVRASVAFPGHGAAKPAERRRPRDPGTSQNGAVGRSEDAPTSRPTAMA